MTKVLVVEDDPSISLLLKAYLERDGATVSSATTGQDALTKWQGCDAVILDLNLPGQIDGLELCRRIRTVSSVPIVMLTARDQEFDRVYGLEMGADDYVTKPFSPRELVARLHAILRRTGKPEATTVLTYDDIVWDPNTHQVTKGGLPVSLTNREFELLGYLISNRSLALSRRQLLDGVWGPEWYGDDRTVDVHIRQLRRKLGDSLKIVTVWGVGYRLE
jgi:DNA-binding response OmpR family regulator